MLPRSKAAIQWQLQWGENEEYLMDLASDGRHVQALADRPELDGLVAVAVDVFWLVSGGRPVGFGPGPIPTADILFAAQTFGLPPDWFLYLARVMDNVFLKHFIDEQSPKAQPATARRRSLRR